MRHVFGGGAVAQQPLGESHEVRVVGPKDGIECRLVAQLQPVKKGAFFHGAKILSTKNGKVGRDCVAIGNIIRNTKVVDDMIAAFEGSEDQPLAERLMRGIEAISGVGLELPIISTSVISGNDPYGRQILGIAGFMGIGLFRPGYWKYGNAPDLEARLGEVQREVFGLASIARAYNVAMAVHNGTGDSVGAGVWDMSGMLRTIDPRWVGFDFDPGYATNHYFYVDYTDKNGDIKAVVLGVGGFLGVGEHLVAVPFDKVKFVNEPVAYTGAAGAPNAGAAKTTSTTSLAVSTGPANVNTWPGNCP